MFIIFHPGKLQLLFFFQLGGINAFKGLPIAYRPGTGSWKNQDSSLKNSMHNGIIATLQMVDFWILSPNDAEIDS